MIEKVFVLNIPHRTDRRYFMMGHLETKGVPQNQITFFEAKYGKDFDTPGDVTDAAIIDGFPNFENFRDWGVNRAGRSYYWNWCRMLREIMQTGEIILILLDDKMLNINWGHLDSCVDWLCKHHSPFRILQVGWATLWKEDYGYVPGRILDGGFIAEGVRAHGDYATVLSPEGAQLLFNEIYYKHYSPEPLFYRLAQADCPHGGLFHLIKSKVSHAPVVDRGDMDFNEE